MSTILLCLVLAVPDGDSLRLKCEGQDKPLSVRIAQIDAPELAHPALHIKEQPFGRQAQQSLMSLCYGKQAVVTPKKLDLYGRTIGAVTCDNKDVAKTQVESGMAWAYLTPKKSGFAKLEVEARKSKLGLWADTDGVPVKPSEWRKNK